MNDRDRAIKLREQARFYDALADLIEAGFLNRVRDGQAGQVRSPSFDAGQATSKPPADDDASKPKEYLPEDLRGRLNRSDPTATAAVQALNYGDRAAADLRLVDKRIRSGEVVVGELEQVVSAWTPHTASLFDQQTSTDPEPGCQSCARVASPGTVGRAKRDQTPWWNPVAREVTLADGSKVGLCEWCRVQVRETGELPPERHVESYRDGVRVKRKSA